MGGIPATRSRRGCDLARPDADNEACSGAKTARAAVRAAILAVAPEAEEDLAFLRPDDSLREMLDLDSLDFLAVMEHVAKLTGVAVPENDYLEVDSLAGFERYLARRMV